MIFVRPTLRETRDVVPDLEACSVQLRSLGSQLDDMTGPVTAVGGTHIRDILDICTPLEAILSTGSEVRHTVPVSRVLSDRDDLHEDLPLVDLGDKDFLDLCCFVSLCHNQGSHHFGNDFCHHTRLRSPLPEQFCEARRKRAVRCG